jgi:AcrR family transcriptional regulator
MAMASAQDILDLKNKVIQTSLDMAAERRWNEIAFDDIAGQSGYSIEDVSVLFADKTDILSAYARQIDMRLKDMFENGAGGESPRDAIFDIMMERFDILNENRKAVISILDSLTLKPQEALESLPFLCRSMSTMMDLAKIDVSGWKKPALSIVLTGIYFKILRCWVNDDTVDMAATMASLDKGLNYFDKLAAI